MFPFVLIFVFSNITNIFGESKTLVAETINAKSITFSLPLKGINLLKSADFEKGAGLFRQEWSAQASDTNLSDTGFNFFGLGPTFSAKSCADCHKGAGRGRPPLRMGEPLKALVMKLGTINGDNTQRFQSHHAYGDQLNSMAIKGVPAEGKAYVEYYSEEGRYGDGSIFYLRKPSYVFHDLKFGQLDHRTITSPRIPPIVAGLGILESISDENILSLADINDVNSDGISGKPNFVWNHANNISQLGRFGWKAEVVNLYNQVAQAAFRDLGLTSRLHPNQPCPPVQISCGKSETSGTTVEISDYRIKVITDYLRNLAPPDRLINEINL